MANKNEELTENEQVIDQETVDSVFGGINQYNTDYNKILDDQDAYLQKSYANQKKNAAQSYQQEQSAAYSDYQRQVDPYGAQAEQLAASGLSNSGYAESLKTQAYVAYQNRVSLARQSYEDSLASFDLAFQEAKMQNDYNRAALAVQTWQQMFEGIFAMITSDNPAAYKQAGQLMQNLNLDKWKGEYSASGDDSAGEEQTDAGGDDVDTSANTNSYGQINSKSRANYILRANGIDPTKLPAEDKIMSPYSWVTAKNSGKTGAEYEVETYSQYANIALNKIIAKYKASGEANIDNFV